MCANGVVGLKCGRCRQGTSAAGVNTWGFHDEASHPGRGGRSVCEAGRPRWPPLGGSWAAYAVELATDSAGNAIAIWRLRASGTTLGAVMTARYSVASDAWSPATLLSDRGEFSLPRLAMDAAGNGMVVWEYGGILHVARYAASGGWSSATMADTNLATDPLVAFDASGSALVTFGRNESGGRFSVYVKRYPAGSATGSVAERVADTVGTGSSAPPDTAMAIDPQGNALLLWTFWSVKTEGVRFNASTGAWSAVEPVWTPVADVDATACGPNAGADAHGNFVAVWWTNCGSGVQRARAQARRYSSASASWGPIVTLADDALAPQVKVDANGNATAVWNSGAHSVQASRFHVASGTWTGAVTVAASSYLGFGALGADLSGHVRIVWWLDPNRGAAPGDNVVAEHSLARRGHADHRTAERASEPRGRRQRQRPQPSVGCGDDWRHADRPHRGGAAAGQGAGRGDRTRSVRINRSVWRHRTAISCSASLPPTSGTGPESTSVRVQIPQAAVPPSPPSGLTASVSGSTVMFNWSPSRGGVTSYLLVAGLTPAFSVPYVTVPLGPTPGFVVPGVPAGTYYVRVLAQNASGTSAASNEVSFTVAGLALPGAPTLHAPAVSGSTVTLSWSAGSGGTPASYLLIASVAPAGRRS